MKDTVLYMLWGGLLILCAALGFIPEAEGLGKAVLVLLGVSCFIPPAVLLWRSIRTGSRTHLDRIVVISACSLGATVVLFLLNVLLALSVPELLGNLLNTLLYLVSAPMACCRYWALSLFLWACLLMTGLIYRKKTK